MSFKLEPSHYENLKSVSFSCDHRLTTRDIREPFLNKSFFMILCGPPGSGKTTMLFNMLSKQRRGQNIYYRVFKNILYVCPLHSRGSIENNPLDDLPADHVFDKLGY